MQKVLRGLATGYMVVAVSFGGVIVVRTPGPANDLATWVEDRTAGANISMRAWFAEVQRGSAPSSVTIPLPPFTVPLRDSQFEDGSRKFRSVAPTAPHVIAPEKSKTPLDMQFAETSMPFSEVQPGAAPSGVTIPLPPFAVPLPQSQFEDGSRRFRSVAPAAPQVIVPEKAKTPFDPQFAEITPPVWNESNRVAERLQASVSPELYANHDLFLYVSKAESGPWAQHMYVLRKQGKSAKGELALLHKWAASTGREIEDVAANGVTMATDTPAGIYQLDPKRFYRKYRSRQWGSQMPNSMFFDWMKNGYATGLAIHGVLEEKEIALLGQRASAGCVHLSPEDSQALFNMIRADYKGMVPRLAMNRKTMTVSNDGKLARRPNGGLDMIQGYRVLVVIENFGGEDRVSTLYMDLPADAG